MSRITLLKVNKLGTDIAYRTILVGQFLDRHIANHRETFGLILNEVIVTVEQT